MIGPPVCFTRDVSELGRHARPASSAWLFEAPDMSYFNGLFLSVAAARLSPEGVSVRRHGAQRGAFAAVPLALWPDYAAADELAQPAY